MPLLEGVPFLVEVDVDERECTERVIYFPLNVPHSHSDCCNRY